MFSIRILLVALAALLMVFIPSHVESCSTFQVRQGDEIAYAHNLNQGDLGIPGMVYINKRGMFKVGRTWEEITTLNPERASELTWISRYGSVTFNGFGLDFIDGGVNEAGLFIWEMGEDAEYPNDPEKPALSQVNWMQYVLDTCQTVEDAIQRAGEVSIDGWGWHYFVGDASGKTASIAFIDGKPLVHSGDAMPVPAMFNSPYDWEMELMRYYDGFGGQYSCEVDDPRVPRFVRYQRLMREMKPSDDVTKYGLMMLRTLKVHDEPEWSVLYNEKTREVCFFTRLNPEVKTFSLSDIDFSNDSPTQILDMDEVKPGNLAGYFVSFTQDADRQFILNKLNPILPENFFSVEMSAEACIENIAIHTNKDIEFAKANIAGTWSNLVSKDEKTMALEFVLKADDAAITGEAIIKDNGEELKLDHISLLNGVMKFTFFTKRGAIVEAVCRIDGNSMQARLNGAEEFYGNYALVKKSM